jgi:hypothetical protein
MPKLKPKYKQLDSTSLVPGSEETVAIINTIYPVGITIHQYPNNNGTWNSDEEPDVLFPGTTWEKQFNDEGIFFKTEGYEPTNIYDNGSLVSYRIDGLSKDKVQRMTGYVRFNAPGRDQGTSANGVFSRDALGRKTSTSSSGNRGIDDLYFNTASSPSARTTENTDERSEPQNRLFRIWKRTA